MAAVITEKGKLKIEVTHDLIPWNIYWDEVGTQNWLVICDDYIICLN